MGKGAAEQAIVLLDRVVAMAPSHAPAFVALANAYGFRSIATTDTGDLEHALRCADRAVELDSGSHAAHTWRGYALMRQGRFAAAADAYRRAAAIDPAHPAAFYFAGSNLLFAGRVGESLPLRQRAVELDPSLGMPWLGLGAAHLSGLALTEAASCFTRARDLEGTPHQFATAAAGAFLAETARLAGRLEEARTHALAGLESAERSDHAYRDTFRAYALVVLGCTALDQGQTEPARAAFGQVLQAEGRPRTRSCGHLVVRALAGMALIAGDVDLFREACRHYDERRTFNFEPFFGALDHQTLQPLSAASSACGLRDEAEDLRARARAALIDSE